MTAGTIFRLPNLKVSYGEPDSRNGHWGTRDDTLDVFDVFGSVGNSQINEYTRYSNHISLDGQEGGG